MEEEAGEARLHQFFSSMEEEAGEARLHQFFSSMEEEGGRSASTICQSTPSGVGWCLWVHM
jgi:hypothetical protein